VSRLDEHIPGNLGSIFQDASAMPNEHTWDNVAAFLGQHNRKLRRRRRMIAAAWFGTPMLVAGLFGAWWGMNSLPELGMANLGSLQGAATEVQRVDETENQNATVSSTHISSAAQTSASSTVNPVATNHSANQIRHRTAVDAKEIIDNDEYFAKTPDAPLGLKQPEYAVLERAIPFSASLMENEIHIAAPKVDDVAALYFPFVEIVSEQNATNNRYNWTLGASLFAQAYSMKDILPQKNVPIENSRTLSNMMLFVPGRGITFQRAVFDRPHQYGAGLLFGYGKRWALDLRAGYYGVTSTQLTDTVMGYSAVKYARFNSLNTYAGARYNVVARPKFSAYLSAGIGTTSAINNDFEIIQYEFSDVVSREQNKQEVQGFKFSGDLAAGVGFRPIPMMTIFAEAVAHHTQGEIKHPNVPSFFNNTFLSLRTGIQFNLK